MFLLRSKDKHVTKDLWEGNERLLRPRRHAIWVLKHEDIVDQRVKHLIDHSSSRHLLQFTNIDFNQLLLTTLVERLSPGLLVELPHHATEDVIAQHARAHILTLIGSILMLDSSSSKVHLMYLLLLADLNNVRNYSWESAVLASLYRVLDHEIDLNQDDIGGCTLLL
uniref:Aminotransferase-like plant mobile domain-containing protein n=1 Tax=Phaseolus vulgaris TaxID=3885 RepID=V7AL24_PHAVU|nr:hypothetical protein PHAVU_011G191000g [Phaseolus vulgaris]ESW05573.1 hypothetical protein PHAVU_011G191000g [Phaseolus vulgaris]